MSDSIVVTSNQPQEAAPSEKPDKVEATEVEQDDTPSAEAQGDEGDETKEDTPKEGEGDGEDPSGEEKPKKKSGIQRLKERHARVEAELRQRLEQLESQGPKGQRDETEKPKVDPSEKPQADKFESHEEFVEALTDWKLEQREKAREQKSKEAQVKEAFDAQRKASQARFEEYSKTNPAFSEAVDEFVETHGDVQRSPALIAAIDDCDVGPAVMHELLKSPDELFRINKLSLTAVAREIGKIEARIAARTSSKTETKPTTKAPPPVKPIGTGSSPVKRTVFNAQSQAEFEQIVLEQRAKRRPAWG